MREFTFNLKRTSEARGSGDADYIARNFENAFSAVCKEHHLHTVKKWITEHPATNLNSISIFDIINKGEKNV